MKHPLTPEGRSKLARLASERFRTHGEASRRRGRSPEYQAWAAMLIRCTKISYRKYKDYGARGIYVCQRWRRSFPNFLADMGRRPTPKHSLDRIDNNGPYTPENCRWATKKEQGRNRRDNVLITVGGETLCVTAWAERLGINKVSIFARLKSGWSPEAAVTTPRGRFGPKAKPKPE